MALDVNLFDTGFLDSMGAVETSSCSRRRPSGSRCASSDVTLYPMNTVCEIAEVVGMQEGALLTYVVS